MTAFSATIHIRETGDGVVVTTDTGGEVKEKRVRTGESLSQTLKGDRRWTTKVRIDPMPPNENEFPTGCSVWFNATCKRTWGCLWWLFLVVLAMAIGVFTKLFGG